MLVQLKEKERVGGNEKQLAKDKARLARASFSHICLVFYVLSPYKRDQNSRGRSAVQLSGGLGHLRLRPGGSEFLQLCSFPGTPFSFLPLQGLSQLSSVLARAILSHGHSAQSPAALHLSWKPSSQPRTRPRASKGEKTQQPARQRQDTSTSGGGQRRRRCVLSSCQTPHEAPEGLSPPAELS